MDYQFLGELVPALYRRNAFDERGLALGQG